MAAAAAPLETIRVYVRVRPDGVSSDRCVKVEESGRQITLVAPPHDSFSFDRIFDDKATQTDVYEQAARPIVEAVLSGYNGAVIAYGQTASGKTYTMRGPSLLDENRGVIPRMVDTVFAEIAAAPPGDEFTLRVSLLEIYMEKIRDLLDARKSSLRVRESTRRGVFVDDLTEVCVVEAAQVLQLLELGQQARATASTLMNAHSSRSHLIFQLSVERRDVESLATRTGLLYLVDLAGSEKIAKTGAEGQTLGEAKMINKSLSALGNVINALTEKEGSSSHVPYRDSKLTRVLQAALGGNAKTALLCTVSSDISDLQETVSTLRFGRRAKLIKNAVIVNQVDTVDGLRLLLEKSERERLQLVERLSSEGKFTSEIDSNAHLERVRCLEQENEDLKRQVDDLWLLVAEKDAALIQVEMELEKAQKKVVVTKDEEITKETQSPICEETGPIEPCLQTAVERLETEIRARDAEIEQYRDFFRRAQPDLMQQVEQASSQLDELVRKYRAAKLEAADLKKRLARLSLEREQAQQAAMDDLATREQWVLQLRRENAGLRQLLGRDGDGSAVTRERQWLFLDSVSRKIKRTIRSGSATGSPKGPKRKNSLYAFVSAAVGAGEKALDQNVPASAPS